MAERVRHNLLTCTDNVDVVAGPDSYRDLPRLLAIARCGSMAINVQLSLEETYADIVPVRKDKFSKTAFVFVVHIYLFNLLHLSRFRIGCQKLDALCSNAFPAFQMIKK